MMMIRVYDNDDNDTGIWHEEIDAHAHELVWSAAMSVSDVYSVGLDILRTTPTSGGFAADDGTTYRYEIQETNR
jgi:hypothetical protein